MDGDKHVSLLRIYGKELITAAKSFIVRVRRRGKGRIKKFFITSGPML
jgi:hypothetical protein